MSFQTPKQNDSVNIIWDENSSPTAYFDNHELSSQFVTSGDAGLCKPFLDNIHRKLFDCSLSDVVSEYAVRKAIDEMNAASVVSGFNTIEYDQTMPLEGSSAYISSLTSPPFITSDTMNFLYDVDATGAFRKLYYNTIAVDPYYSGNRIQLELVEGESFSGVVSSQGILNLLPVSSNPSFTETDFYDWVFLNEISTLVSNRHSDGVPYHSDLIKLDYLGGPSEDIKIDGNKDPYVQGGTYQSTITVPGEGFANYSYNATSTKQGYPDKKHWLPLMPNDTEDNMCLAWKNTDLAIAKIGYKLSPRYDFISPDGVTKKVVVGLVYKHLHPEITEEGNLAGDILPDVILGYFNVPTRISTAIERTNLRSNTYQNVEVQWSPIIYENCLEVDSESPTSANTYTDLGKHQYEYVERPAWIVPFIPASTYVDGVSVDNTFEIVPKKYEKVMDQNFQEYISAFELRVWFDRIAYDFPPFPATGLRYGYFIGCSYVHAWVGKAVDAQYGPEVIAFDSSASQTFTGGTAIDGDPGNKWKIGKSKLWATSHPNTFDRLDFISETMEYYKLPLVKPLNNAGVAQKQTNGNIVENNTKMIMIACTGAAGSGAGTNALRASCTYTWSNATWVVTNQALQLGAGSAFLFGSMQSAHQNNTAYKDATVGYFLWGRVYQHQIYGNPSWAKVEFSSDTFSLMPTKFGPGKSGANGFGNNEFCFFLDIRQQTNCLSKFDYATETPQIGTSKGTKINLNDMYPGVHISQLKESSCMPAVTDGKDFGWVFGNTSASLNNGVQYLVWECAMSTNLVQPIKSTSITSEHGVMKDGAKQCTHSWSKGYRATGSGAGGAGNIANKNGGILPEYQSGSKVSLLDYARVTFDFTTKTMEVNGSDPLIMRDNVIMSTQSK